MQDLKERTKQFAIDVFRLCEQYPRGLGYTAYCNQLVRSSSSVGANYRAACRAKSPADFINKLKIVEEEVDESVFFLELLKEIDGQFSKNLDRLIKEGNELTAIVVTSIKTAKRNNGKK